MMRVTVEVWPGGDHLRPKRLATIEIANISGLASKSDYSVIAVLDPGREGQVTLRDRVTNHERDRGWQRLVRRTLERLEAHAERGSTHATAKENG
jgi:hypothetical protein